MRILDKDLQQLIETSTSLETYTNARIKLQQGKFFSEFNKYFKEYYANRVDNFFADINVLGSSIYKIEVQNDNNKKV